MNRHRVFLLPLLTVIPTVSFLLRGQSPADGNPRYTPHRPELSRETGALTNTVDLLNTRCRCTSACRRGARSTRKPSS